MTYTSTERRVGAPSKIHDARRLRKMLRLVQRGTPRSVAARVSGINVATWARWQQRARAVDRIIEEGLDVQREDLMYREFCELVDRAVAHFETRAATALLDMSLERNSPSVLLEMLSRHPETRERWRQHASVEVTGPNGGPLLVDDVASMSDEELAARLERLEMIAAERDTGNVHQEGDQTEVH